MNPTYVHLGEEYEAYTVLTIRKPTYGQGNRFDYETNILLLQMSAKKGLEQYGERADAALLKEYKHFVPVWFNCLSPDERKKTLNVISLTEKQRAENIKARTVADGSKQRDYIPRWEATSSTVTTEAVLITSSIEAKPRRIVITCNISGAFLQAYMGDHVIVVFRNEAINLLVKSNNQILLFI